MTNMESGAVRPEITVYLSSPGDTAPERKLVKTVIEEINSDPIWQTRCVLKPLAYEDCVPSQMGSAPQRVVDDFMRKSSQADLVVCILCNRMGTPIVDDVAGTPYRSGTHYELDTAYQALKRNGGSSPRLMLYLGYREPAKELHELTDDEIEQFKRAREFKNEIKFKGSYDGLFAEYRELHELEDQVRRDIKLHLARLIGARQPAPKPVRSAALEAYLQRLAESYRWLELQGIREAGTLRIELEKVYVALKAEPESEYERHQAANLHSIEVQEAAGVEAVDVIDPQRLEELDAANIRRTYRPAREAVKRAAVTEQQTVADAFRMYRRMVILGSPGSGKSTLGRWMALQFARGLQRQLDCEEQVNVKVPVSQVDPDPGALRDLEELVDLGPARLPIFLRISHYARDLVERERQRLPTRELIDYLGLDPDSCSLGDDCTPEGRNALFQSFLDSQQAIVILDGLDELAEANRRPVLLKIHDFIEKVSLKDDPTKPPWKVGGNQVVVTSRYVGYKPAPVRADAAHFGIQPMQRPAVERFAHSWSEAVNAELAAEQKQFVVAEKLIAEIYNETRPAIRELATNPLLVTILATVYWADGHLPDQRSAVYDRVVENLLRIWLQREECRSHYLTREELLAALEPLAADMQENANSNDLVSLDRVGEVMAEPLAHLRGMSPTDRRFRPIREALLATIRQHVGLLAEQSPGNYAFFHRTFQEFLAARYLLADRETAGPQIIGRLDDPLWREPLLLALGFAMVDPEWGPAARKRLLEEILAADATSDLIPRSALLIVTALPDLRDAPDVIVEHTAARLLSSYAMCLDQPQAGGLREQIEQAFVRLKEGRHADTVAREIATIIRRQRGELELAGAAGVLLRRIDWFTTELLESLLLVVHRDRAQLNWPLRRALLAGLGYRPATNPAPRSPRAISMARLLVHLPMRRLLETQPELLTLVMADQDWLWLMIALYGGLGHSQFLEQLARYTRERVQETQVTAGNFASEGPTERLRPSAPSSPLMQFSPLDIVHDLADQELSRRVQQHLRARKPAFELMPLLRRKWTEGDDPASCTEALLGLAALGEDVIPLLREALRAGRQSPVQTALERFGWLRLFLQEPIVRTFEVGVRTIPEHPPEAHQLDLLAIVLDTLLACGSPPVKVSARLPAYRYINAETPASIATLEAEYWSWLFSGLNNDGLYRGSTAINALHISIGRPVDLLIHAWSLMHKARNHSASRRLAWPQAVLPERANSPEERFLAMLDSMSTVPREYQFAAGYVLGRCRIFLEEYPQLLWETIALVWSMDKIFFEGCCAAPASFVITDGALASLRKEGVPESLLLKLRGHKGQEFETRDSFIRRVSSEVHSIEWSHYEDLVLAHAALRPWAEDDPLWTSMATFPQQAARIDDPYLRFRALWRFMSNQSSNEDKRAIDVLLPLDELGDPYDQVRAFVWIFMSFPAHHFALATQMVQAAARIQDPENRARAQCRLAFFAFEFAEQLLRDAIDSIEEIDDLARRAETIVEIRDAWRQMPEIQEALSEIAQAIPDAWQREKALGRSSRLVQLYRSHYSTGSLIWRILRETPWQAARSCRSNDTTGSLTWGLIYLSATATEVERFGATSTANDAQWVYLLGPQREAAVAKLVSAGIESGTQVTPREAAILDRLVQSGHGRALESLWPILERADPGALATVMRWLPRSDLAAQWAALVHAEAGRFTPEVITSVIDLLASSTDRLHYRAAMALHGRFPYGSNKARRWSVRRAGIEAVEAVAQRAVQSDLPPAVRTALQWVHCDIHHDDAKALARWLGHPVSENADPTVACWILEGMESIQADLLPLLCDALADGPPKRQRALLRGLARLAHCSGESVNPHAEALLGSLSCVSAEVRASVYGLADGPETILEIARQMAVMSGEDGYLAQACQMLQEKLIWVDETALSSGGSAVRRLGEIGKHSYVWLGSYWDKANKAAAAIIEKADVLRVLLSWLSSPSGNSVRNLRADLLTATEAVARQSPSAFAVVADPEVWEPILTEWVMSENHWTARIAAIRLLGRLRRVTDRVVVALKAAMSDVSLVQAAAYESAGEFRSIEGDIWPELLRLLDDPSAGVAAAATRLLVGVGCSDGPAADRRQILGRLKEVAARPSANRAVYLWEETGRFVNIRYFDRLDRIFYRAIFEISRL